MGKMEAVKMRKYCNQCGREVETRIISKQEKYEVCGETFDVDAQVLVCMDCGGELFCEELDNDTLLKAYNEYRKNHKLLLPDEIKKIREQYGLSQRGFAKLLNWGDKTIHRYENGSIQDKAHNSLLLFLREPENMKKYLSDNEIMLDERQKNKLLDTINSIEKNFGKSKADKVAKMFFSDVPSIQNGYKVFDYEKLCAVVLFFANKSEELLKVKLLKLINYTDMIYYKENGVSITGGSYLHMQYGPVLQNYDIIFGMMTADNIMHIDIVFDNGYEKHKVVSDHEFPKGVLTKAEIDVLERIYNKFSDFGSAEISNYSHNEKGYSSTKHGEIIPYSYAKEIQLD